MSFPLADGKGVMPDSWREAFGYVIVIVFWGGLLVFTGVDAQIEYALTSPGSYFGLSVVDSPEESTIVFTSEQVDGLNFATKNRIGINPIGDEIGLCGGIRDGVDVYNLRVAEGFSSTSPTSVTFSCALPRDLTVHSQPGFSDGFSEEDLDYRGEFRPEVSCIQFREAVASPVSGKVSGLNCIDTESGDTVVPVVR